MLRKKRRTAKPRQQKPQLWAIRVKGDRRPIAEVPRKPLLHAAVKVVLNQQREAADEVLAKAKRSRSLNRKQKIADAEQEIEQIEALRGRFEDYFNGKTNVLPY